MGGARCKKCSLHDPTIVRSSLSEAVNRLGENWGAIALITACGNKREGLVRAGDEPAFCWVKDDQIALSKGKLRPSDDRNGSG